MSRVNLIWFLNESCRVLGFCSVHGRSLPLMIFVKKKFMANVYFCVRMVYPLLHSVGYTNTAGNASFRCHIRFRKEGQI